MNILMSMKLSGLRPGRLTDRKQKQHKERAARWQPFNNTKNYALKI